MEQHTVAVLCWAPPSRLFLSFILPFPYPLDFPSLFFSFSTCTSVPPSFLDSTSIQRRCHHASVQLRGVPTRYGFPAEDEAGTGSQGTYTTHKGEDKLDGQTTSLPPTPIILEPGASPGSTTGRGELSKEHSVSAEYITELGKLEGKGHLGVMNLSEGCRAYSDGQLAPATTGRSTESVGRDDQPPPSPSYSTSGSSTFSFKSQQRSHARAKLSAAKLHLKSLFGQHVVTSVSVIDP
ncbi:unnamed protein product [Coregonus sp. 'balchen']|nr:unnamed protein product [Coregonus sp. 'balchen']